MLNVHQRVFLLRKKLKFTQAKLAAAAGLQRLEISRLEGGRNKATSNRVRSGIANATGLQLVDLNDYLDGRIELTELLHRRDRSTKQREKPALSRNLRALLNDPDAELSPDEITQASLFVDIRGFDLTVEQWRRYVGWLRAATDRIAGEAAMERAGFDGQSPSGETRKARTSRTRATG